MLTIAVSLRAEQAELYRPTIELQDYEMVEFFIKRLKLWMGLTKAKEVGCASVVVQNVLSQSMLLIPHISCPF